LKSESHVRRAFKRIVLVEAGVLGAISALAQILPLIQWQIWLTVFILVGMSSAILVWRSTKSVHLPEELVLDAVAVDGRVVVEVPASHDMLVVANKHARMLYGRDCPTLTEVERWWGRNPWVFAVLRSEWGDYLGYFDILPLTEEGAGLVESGEIEERDIRPDHILSPAEMKDALFVGPWRKRCRNRSRQGQSCKDSPSVGFVHRAVLRPRLSSCSRARCNSGWGTITEGNRCKDFLRRRGSKRPS